MRRARLITVAATAAAALCVPAAASAAWTEPVPGPLNIDPARNVTAADVVSVGGVPYVAWTEANGTADQVHVAQLAGGARVPVGGSLNIDPTHFAASPRLADVGGVPYVVWLERATSGINQVHVARWDGSSWSVVGGVLNANPASETTNPSIASIGGVPYVAWSERSSVAPGNFAVRVARLSGSTWSPVGGALTEDPTNQTNIGIESLADVGGVPYLAWEQDTGSGSELVVQRFDGTSWNDLSAGLNATPGVSEAGPSIASVGGTLYLAWAQTTPPAANAQIMVARFGGLAWTVSGPLNADPSRNAVLPLLAAVGGVPYLSFSEQNGSAYQGRVERFSDPTWGAVGGSLNPDPGRDGVLTGLADVGGAPHAALVQATATAQQLHVLRYAPDSTGTTPTGTTPTGTTPTHTTPQTTAIIPPLRVSIRTRSATVSKGRAHVTLACASRTPAGSCTGTLSLTITVHVHRKVKGKRRTVARRVTLAKARYRAATGASTTVSLHLTRSARSRLAHAGKGTLHTRARATLSGGSSATRSVTLLATPRLHRKATG